MRRTSLLLIATLGVTPLASPQNESVFRATTQLVQIDVVAQDKNGQPVGGLNKDDFELFVNHKPRQIATFTPISDTPAPPVTLPRGTFSNKQAATEVVQGRYTAFLLDWHETNWMLQSWSHQELQKMLTSLPEGSKAALYLINTGFQIIQEYTSDHDLLKAKADSLWGQVQAPFGPGDAELATHQTVAAFEAISKHLSGISGQKVLVWISTGFPGSSRRPPGPPGARVAVMDRGGSAAAGDDIDKAVRLLGNANIVVESAAATYLGASVLPELGPTGIDPNSLGQIAQRTGGRFFGPANDLAANLLTAANDRAISYELGYYAEDNLQPGLQPFEIRCKRSGITLRYREGFYVDKPMPPAPPPDTRTAAEEILEGAVDAVAIPLTATVTRTMGNIASVIVKVTADASALALHQDGNLWRGKVAFLARFANDEEDQLGDVPLDTPAVNLTQEEHDRLLRDGLSRRFTMKLPAGATSLRVLVGDENSGNAGTVTIPLDDLPEF